MSDPLLARAAFAQADVIRLSLTRQALAGSSLGGGVLSGVTWLQVWNQARDYLMQMCQGSGQQCAALVWREVDLAADLSGQSWWTCPRLQQAAIGEIAWATVLGRWVEGVPSADAQHQWDAGYALATAVRRRRSAPALGRRRAYREHVNQIAGARRSWEDAWWSWATTAELDSGRSIQAARSVSGLAVA